MQLIRGFQAVHLKKGMEEIYIDVANIFMETLGEKFKPLQVLYQKPENHIHRTIAGLNGKNVVGGLKYSYCDISNYFLIDCLAVSPNLWRNGIGKHLTTALENLALEKNVSGIKAQVNNDSVDFYSKLGYSVMDNQRVDVSNITWMSKLISRKPSFITH